MDKIKNPKVIYNNTGFNNPHCRSWPFETPVGLKIFVFYLLFLGGRGFDGAQPPCVVGASTGLSRLENDQGKKKRKTEVFLFLYSGVNSLYYSLTTQTLIFAVTLG